MFEIKQGIFNFLSIILQIITAGGLVYFAWRQTQINKRMKELQDYVAISIVPMSIGTNSIKVMNVGKMNLYLKQYVIEKNTEIFPNPLLLPAGTGENSNLNITLQSLQPVMQTKFYLIDELGDKYISTGQIIVEQLSPVSSKGAFPESGTSITIPQPVLSTLFNFKIWTFKTKKYDWVI